MKKFIITISCVLFAVFTQAQKDSIKGMRINNLYFSGDTLILLAGRNISLVKVHKYPKGTDVYIYPLLDSTENKIDTTINLKTSPKN